MRVVVINTHGLGGEMNKAAAEIVTPDAPEAVEQAVSYITGVRRELLTKEALGDMRGVWVVRTADGKVAVAAVERMYRQPVSLSGDPREIGNLNG